MKKYLWSAITVCLMLVILVSTSTAQNQKFRVRVVAEQANIRVKPDIGSEMLFQVPEGTELEAEKKEGEWFLVLYERSDGSKGRGYVHESLVEVVQPDKTSIQKTLPPPKETGKVEKPSSAGGKKAETQPAPRPSIRTQRTFSSKDFSFELSGGGFYLKAAEINQAARGVLDYYQYYLGEASSRKIRPLHLGLNFGAEIFYRIYSGLYAGFGFEYQQRETTQRLEYTAGTEIAYSVLVREGIRDWPLRLSVMYEPNANFYLKVGIEYHLARLTYFYSAPLSLAEPASAAAIWQGKATGNSLGWMEAVGYRYQLTSWLKAFVEGSYRYVRIKNFEGTNSYENTLGVTGQEKGRLYQWEAEVTSGRTFPVMFIRETRPTEPGVLNVRTANISFSGLALRFGFHLMF